MKKITIIGMLILSAYIALYIFKMSHIMTIENVSNMYDDIVNGDTTKVQQVYDAMQQYRLIGIGVTILMVICKILLYALIVFVAYYLIDTQKFFPILYSVTIAESINVLCGIVSNVNLAYINPPSSLPDMLATPLSLSSFFDVDKLDQWMLIPLSSVNIFEILYVILLSYLLSRSLNRPFGNSCKLVLYSYGLFSLFVIVGITFINVYATR